jgi:hypothetical protein
MPVREKRTKAPAHVARPFSRPSIRTERRETARLFVYSPGILCRDRLAAGGREIRTLGPPPATCYFRSTISIQFGCVAIG